MDKGERDDPRAAGQTDCSEALLRVYEFLDGELSTWPRRILKPGEPLREIPGAPQTHGMAITVHLGGDSAIWRLVGGGCPQDQATTERQRLRGRMRAGERLQLCPCLVR